MPVAIRDSAGVRRTVERLVAYNDVEVTNAVNAANTIMSAVSGISIPATNLIRITCMVRKTANVNVPQLGLRINATIVLSTAAAIAFFDNNAGAESGIVEFLLMVGETGYVQTGLVHSVVATTNYGAAVIVTTRGFAVTADIPVATITSLAITGNATNVAVTVATKNLKVYA